MWSGRGKGQKRGQAVVRPNIKLFCATIWNAILATRNVSIAAFGTWLEKLNTFAIARSRSSTNVIADEAEDGIETLAA